MTGTTPILIDEWQRVPASWDFVRRSVDQSPQSNRFLLTGSSNPGDPATHSGAGRIVRVRMRPLSLAERGLVPPVTSLGAMLRGERPEISGESPVSLGDYTNEIVASGFPAIRSLAGRALRSQLESYVARVVDKQTCCGCSSG